MNGAAALWAQSILRRNRRATLFLALFAGVVGAVVMTSAEVARRTSSAYERFTAYADPPEASFFACTGSEMVPDQCISDEAVDSAIATVDSLIGPGHATEGVVAVVAFDNPLNQPYGRSDTVAYAAYDPGGLPMSIRPVIVDGRLVDPAADEEVVVNEWFANTHRVGVGSTLTIRPYDMTQLDRATDAVAPSLPPRRATIVGIVRVPEDLRAVPDNGGVPTIYDSNNGRLYLGAGWRSALTPDTAAYGRTALVNLPNDITIDDLRAMLDDTLGNRPHEVYPVDEWSAAIRKVIGLQARSAWIVALIALLGGLLFVGQAVFRQVAQELADHPTVAALGFPRRSIVAVALRRSAPIAVGAVAVAVVASVLASPLGPIGVARRAEVDPGIRVDWPVLALGGVSLVAIVVATVLEATWRTTRVSVPRQRRPVGRWADGLPITGRAGLALGRGAGVGSSVSRAAIVSSALGATAVVVTATLLLSMNALRSHPERFGVAFDAHVGNSASPDGIRADFEAIDATAAIDAAGEENSFPVSIGDYTTTIGAVLDHKGHIGSPPPLSGRFPSTVDEIAVGLRTAERLGLHIGSRIEQVRSLTSQDVVLGPYTVVGIVTPMSNGDAAGDGFTAIWDEAVKLETFDRSNGIVVRFNPNMSPAEAIAAIRAAKDSADRRRFELTVQLPQPPTEILNVSNIRRTPGVLAALLAAMATAALVHSVVTTVRRQRRQLGVLRALGFTRSQVAATVGWHATLLVGAAAVIGVPVGVIAGRWAWRLITSRLYVVSAPEVPWLAFALTVVGLFAIANLVALIPGRRAARLDVAETLRTD